MRAVATTILLAGLALPLGAQPDGWTRPFPGHRVIGNLYAVGTYDLGVFLITSEDGHILINTALEDSTEVLTGFFPYWTLYVTDAIVVRLSWRACADLDM